MNTSASDAVEAAEAGGVRALAIPADVAHGMKHNVLDLSIERFGRHINGEILNVNRGSVLCG